MKTIEIISTKLDRKNLKKNNSIYLGDFAASIDTYNKKKIIYKNKLNIYKIKNILNFNKKILNILYE